MDIPGGRTSSFQAHGKPYTKNFTTLHGAISLINYIFAAVKMLHIFS